MVQGTGRRREYPDTVALRSGDRYLVVRLAEIEWVEADGNYTRLHGHKRVHVMSQSLTRLEHTLLDPRLFQRVHRSAIVNVRAVAALEPLGHGDMRLLLAGGHTVPCSRRYRSRLAQRLVFAH
ncbi:MAG TPA: LytTR family DNA-binding domain-containing protein [Gammaproteobacteria bacterium]|nr:LytTR family DNA-binding domain-containing protein [Gammaproteobacteria bacterium]